MIISYWKKSIWTKIEDLKTIDLNILPVYDDRQIKMKIITCDDFLGIDVPENGVECKPFTVISSE